MSSRSSRRSSSQRRRKSYVELEEEQELQLRLQRRRWSHQHGLGLTVAGGGGSFPYRGDERGIFVAKVVSGGAADAAGLRVNDEILTINGIHCSVLDHAQAVNLLRNSDGDLIVRIRRQVPRLVESAVPLAPNFAPLVRSRSSFQLSPSRKVKEGNSRSRTPDPPRRRRSQAYQSEDVYPATPMEESGYLRPRTPPARRRLSSTNEPGTIAPYPTVQHNHLDSTGVHFHPYCFACNPSVIHLRPNSFSAPLQLTQVSNFTPQHIYSTPTPSNGYPSPIEVHRFGSRPTSTDWSDDDVNEQEDSDSNRLTVRLQRDDLTGLGFIVSSRDGKTHSTGGVYVSGVVKGGAADRSGQLYVGDRILSINGLDVEQAKHSEVVALLSRSKPYVQLEIERDPSNDAEVFLSETEPENFPAVRRSTLRSSIISNRSEAESSTSTPWKSNYSEINHAPKQGARPLKSSLKPTSYFPRNDAPIATTHNKRPERYPSPPPSPPPPPLPRLSSSSIGPLTNIDPSRSRLSELEFPPPPTELGRFRETITKNTLTETVVTRVTSNQRGQQPVIIEDVVIHKDIGSRLGLRIAGGKDSSCIPFGIDEPGIFISRVIPQGTAAKTGRLRIGDRLLKINGQDVTNWTHPEVIRALSDPAQQIILTVRHDPSPEGLDEFLIQRRDDEQFGIKIIGGVREQDSYYTRKYDSGIFVSQIHRGGAIAKDGRVKVGMRLLEVNGSNVIGVTRREAIDAFRRAGHVLRLMVCDGWNNENTGTAKLVDSDDVMSNRSSVMSNSSRTDRRGSVSSVRHQQVHPSKQPNVTHNGFDDNGSTRSTPSLKKKLLGMKIPDLAGSKHFPKTNQNESEVKTTTIVLSKTYVDKPDNEVFDEDYEADSPNEKSIHNRKEARV